MSDLGELAGRTVTTLSAKRPGVVVAAIRGDEVAVRGSAGFDGSTRFEIGSITKVFTALTLARQAAPGTLDLDQPLGDLLPVPAGCAITLRHLGTHTAGLPRLPTGMLLEALLRPGKADPYAKCSEDFVLRALARTRLRPVGRDFRYSNFGAGLLGLALTRHAHQDFSGLVTAQLGSLLPLTGTSTDGPTVPGHRANGRPASPWHLNALAGAGGLRSTTDDLVTLVRAHLAPSPITPAVDLALSVEHRANPFLTAHLGWLSRRLKDRRQFFHNGGTGGFASFAGFDPVAGTGVVALSATARSVDGPAFDLLTALG